MAQPPGILQGDSITDAIKPEAMPVVGQAPAAAAAPVQASQAAQVAEVPAAIPPGVSATPSATAMQTGGAAPALPAEGVLQGKAMLNPALAPKVPEGAPRPFAMAEHVINPDGSVSNEISITVQDKSLNGGKPTLLPSLWVVDGKPTRVNDDQAVQFAKQSGLSFKSFDTPEAAEKFAVDRETAWQTTRPEDAGKVEPLWSQGAAKGTTEKPGAIEATSKPAAGILRLTPELIQRVLSDPKIQERLREISKPPAGDDSLEKLQQAQRGAGALDKKN